MLSEPDLTSIALTLALSEHYILPATITPRHGLGIFEEVARQTDNRILLVPGTLYTALKRLVGAGLIMMVDPPPDDRSGGAPRKFYQTTELGRRVLEARVQWLSDEAQRIQAVLEAGDSKPLEPYHVVEAKRPSHRSLNQKAQIVL